MKALILAFHPQGGGPDTPIGAHPVCLLTGVSDAAVALVATHVNAQLTAGGAVNADGNPIKVLVVDTQANGAAPAPEIGDSMELVSSTYIGYV